MEYLKTIIYVLKGLSLSFSLFLASLATAAVHLFIYVCLEVHHHHAGLLAGRCLAILA